MTVQTILVLVVSTISLVLIGYFVLTPILRKLERPDLLLPWKRKERVSELQEMAAMLLREPLSADDRLAVERALNTLSIPGVQQLTGPWSRSDPIVDAERDILSVSAKVASKRQQAGAEHI